MSDNIEASRFCLIPLEIRRNVLQLLLIRRPYIYCGIHIDARIARVNRQLYRESLSVLYGENDFRVEVNSRYEQATIGFRRCEDFTDQHEIEFKIPLYKLIRRFDIFVNLPSYEETESIKSAVRKVATFLSDMPQLDHLRIEFGSSEYSAEQLVDYSHMLEPFRLLRNVHHVDIRGGVSKPYAQYLKTTMQGQTPVDHLPKMYSLLEDLIGSTNEYDDDLQRGIEAMTDDDVQTFRSIRAEVVAKFVERTQARLNRLRDHDSDPEQHHWVIQKISKSKRQRR